MLAASAAVGSEEGGNSPIQRWPPSLVHGGTLKEDATHCGHCGRTQPVPNLCEAQHHTASLVCPTVTQLQGGGCITV